MKITDHAITKIGVSNFKAFKYYTELELDKLTIIAGLNSCGKSSIYQALLLLCQSDRSFAIDKFNNTLPVLKLNGDFIEFGTPSDILNDSSNKSVAFKIFWDDKTFVETVYTVEHKARKPGDDLFVLSCFSYHSGDGSSFKTYYSKGKWKVQAKSCLSFANYSLAEKIIKKISEKLEGNKCPDPFSDKVTFTDVTSFDFSLGAPVTFGTKLSHIYKCIEPKYRKYIKMDDIENYIKVDDKNKDMLYFNFTDVKILLEHQLRRHIISYVQPFRGYPKRVYANDSSPNPLAIYSKQKNNIIPYRYNFEESKVVNGTVEDALNYWVVNHFALADHIEVREIIPRLVSEIFLTMSGKHIPINNVGFGTSQIIPVIFTILTSQANFIVVDEPEIHLHASVQSKLATFFFEMMSIGKNLLVETHSEYLIDKIIYHNILQPNDGCKAKLCWVKKSNSESVIEMLEHDDLGFILNAPDGFMSEKKKLVIEINELRMSKNI
jgi:predicted ATPase